MDDHGSTLLSIIKDVYGAPPLVLNSSPGDAEISEGQPPSGSSTTSNSKSHTTLQSRKVPTVTNAALVRPLDIVVSILLFITYAVLESNPQYPKKASMSLPADSNILVQPLLSFPHDSIQISTHTNSFQF